MEEKDMSLPEEIGNGEGVVDTADQAATADNAEAAPVGDGASPSQEESVTPTSVSEGQEISLDWKFSKGEAVAPLKRKTNAKRFTLVFSAVVAVCLAFLVALLFVGEAGIKIYRTVTHERTVFVEGSGSGENGLLAPEQAAELVRRSTVTVSVRTKDATGHGSGFVYTENGYICTNHHVIEDAISVQVVLPSGEAIDATVVGSDAMSDLAVLKVDRTDLTPLKLGSSHATLVGETVVAVGTPAKLDYAGTATFGKISATNRIVSLTNDEGVVTKKMTVLQTDTSVNPGNSGGPLANMYGEVVGIVVMKVSYFGGTVFDGIGFAIPIDGARVVLDAIIRDGHFSGENPVATGRSLLGIAGIGVVGGYWYSDPAVSDRTQSKNEVAGYTYIPYDGVYVTAINQPNAQDKLQVGDIITKINGLNMYTVYDVINQVNRLPVYTTVNVTLMRPVGDDYEQRSVSILLLEE